MWNTDGDGLIQVTGGVLHTAASGRQNAFVQASDPLALDCAVIVEVQAAQHTGDVGLSLVDDVNSTEVYVALRGDGLYVGDGGGGDVSVGSYDESDDRWWLLRRVDDHLIFISHNVMPSE